MKLLYSLFLFLLAGHLAGQSLVAVNDTIDLVPGVPKTVMLLANDTIPAGDSITVKGGTAFPQNIVINTWKNKGFFTYVAPHWGHNATVEGTYVVTDVTIQKASAAKIIIRIHDHSYDSIAINNIDAVFNASGLNFFLPYADPYGQKGFIVPKGSGKKTIFSGSQWIGGLDQDSNVYCSGERYRQGAGFLGYEHMDYYAGPVMDSANYSVYQDTIWNKIWKLKKTEIEYHKLHYQDPGYLPVHDILTWPGNGDVNLGEAAQLAPFYDRNSDGIYHPMDGDYPLIRGDQALYFIFNENRGPHLETGGQRSLKAEFHVMVYAWDLPEDSAFNNTLFMNYKIFNRSQRTYYKTFLGIFTDVDLGFANDDYIGCDVYRGSYFCYNGTPIDGSGQPNAYGAHPPAQSITFLAGPKMDPTGKDLPRFDDNGHQLCNESINGFGFGDGIPDNERMGLNSFSWFSYSNSGTPSYMNNPVYSREYYNALCGRWLDSTYMIYGGLGHEGFGGVGPQCRFMFPGESDTLNWGVGCQPPNGEKNWTEKTAGIVPGDRRGLGTVGPFTFLPGAMKELDLAYVFARDYNSPDALGSVAKLRQMIDVVRHSFATNKLPGGGSFTAVPERSRQNDLTCTVYPNPATSFVNIMFESPLKENFTVRLIDGQGKMVQWKTLSTGTTESSLELPMLPNGIYLLVIQSSQFIFTRKLAVNR